MIKKPKYIKPKLKSRKVRISFFLTQSSWLNHFSFIGNVYAQSGAGLDGSYDGGYGPDGGYDGDYVDGTDGGYL